jgi:glycosyltransferase involved in cell wall biosynthesis
MFGSALVMIPAYNAGRTITELIERLVKHVSDKDIVVIDDGALDNTGDLARETGVTVLAHETNRGKGAALRTGFQYAIENDYGAVLTIDADLQHDPDCVPGFLEMASSGNYDVIIGTRERTADMPAFRVFANFAGSVVISLFSGARIRDSQSGYRWIRTDTIKRLRLRCERYDLESEILVAIGRSGGSIGEISIPTIYGESESFIVPLVDAARVLRMLLRSLFW